MARRLKNQALSDPRGPSAAAPIGSLLSTNSWLRLRQAASTWSERKQRIKAHEATFILRSLATLVDNGVPLPRALATLAKEDSLARHREVLDGICRKVESGVPFSTALAECPGIWDRVSVAQIRVGERSGTLATTLGQLAETRHKTRELRQQVVWRWHTRPCWWSLAAGLLCYSCCKSSRCLKRRIATPTFPCR